MIIDRNQTDCQINNRDQERSDDLLAPILVTVLRTQA